MDLKKIIRNEKFCNNIKKRDVKCVLSGKDIIQCEAAHIVPLNGLYGQVNFKNPELLNDESNGMLLSKELHILYDKFIWSINPNNFDVIEGIPKLHKYSIQVVDNYKELNISINNYKYITLKAECHNNISIAYNIFKSIWNPSESYYEKLEVLPTSILYKTNITYNNYITIENLSDEARDKLDNELSYFINYDKEKRNKILNKKKKNEIASQFNLHEQSLETYFKKLKKSMTNRLNTP